MKFTVVNKGIQVQHIKVMGVSSSSVFIIGDTQSMTCSSIFDTPPETVIVGQPPLVPLNER